FLTEPLATNRSRPCHEIENRNHVGRFRACPFIVWVSPARERSLAGPHASLARIARTHRSHASLARIARTHRSRRSLPRTRRSPRGTQRALGHRACPFEPRSTLAFAEPRTGERHGRRTKVVDAAPPFARRDEAASSVGNASHREEVRGDVISVRCGRAEIGV